MLISPGELKESKNSSLKERILATGLNHFGPVEIWTNCKVYIFFLGFIKMVFLPKKIFFPLFFLFLKKKQAALNFVGT